MIDLPDPDEAKARIAEKQIFHQLAQEIKEDYIIDTIWAKALALSGGDKSETKSKYIELRVQDIKDHLSIQIEEENERRKKRPTAEDYDDASDYEKKRGY